MSTNGHASNGHAKDRLGSEATAVIAPITGRPAADGVNFPVSVPLDLAPVTDEDIQIAATILRFSLDKRVSGQSAREAKASRTFRDLFRAVYETEKTLRNGWPFEWTEFTKNRNPGRAAYVRRALDAAIPIVEAEPDDPRPDHEAGGSAFRLEVIGSKALAEAEFPRTWLIEGLLAKGQPCVVGGPKKALKTSLMVDLAISLGHGATFLGEFAPPRRFKTLFISGESGDATTQETARRVCLAKGIDLDELEGQVFWGFSLPKLSEPEHMEALASLIRENEIEVVILDPLYLCLLSGNSKLDAANLFDVGPLLANITRICLDAGATPLLVHHFRKNREAPNDPPELEDLAFAGVQEFARQWLLVGRRERYEPGTGEHRLWLNIGGSAGHSGTWAIDVSEGIIDRDFKGRRWDVTINRASDARAASQAEAATIAAERKIASEEVRQQAKRKATENDAWKIRDVIAASNAPLSKRQIRNKTALGPAKVDAAMALLEDEWNLVEIVEATVSCGNGIRPVSGYQIKPDGTIPPTLDRSGSHRSGTGSDRCPDTGTVHRSEGGESIYTLPLGQTGVPVSGCEGDEAGNPSEVNQNRTSAAAYEPEGQS